MKARDIASLEEILAYHFSRPVLLEQALTHSSQAREQEANRTADAVRVGDNEQLEFLGDAVLSLVTTEQLYRSFPQFREGELSKLRAHLVSERHLIQVAQQLQLGDYLRLGRGEEKSGGRLKQALLVDALEAVLGAIYLDGGLEPARQFVFHNIIQSEIGRIGANGSLPLSDYKSALQEKLQAHGMPQPVYVLVKEHGPEHSKTFTVEARLPARVVGAKAEFTGRAEGTTKKNAEQRAAQQVLEYLASLPDERNGASPKGRT